MGESAGFADRFPVESWAVQWGIELVAGADEVGRGALAGPLVAAAVLLPTRALLRDDSFLRGIRDSKKMAPGARIRAAKEIMRRALDWVLVYIPPWEVDQQGVQECNREGLARALLSLRPEPQLSVVDHLYPGELPFPCLGLSKGEDRSLAVAAASILAKVARDATMINLSFLYPGYGWERNKGYGTEDHLRAIRERGTTPAHRQSFRSVAQMSLW